MSDLMDCGKAEELLSDHLDGTLGDVLRDDVDRHLRTCANCQALREALAEVVATLKGHPVLDPPAGLAERAATAALARRVPASTTPRTLLQWRPPAGLQWRRPAGFQLLAAALALAFTGLVVVAAPRSGGTGRKAARLFERSLGAGAYLMEKKDRLFEDVRILSVVISTAFQGRLDRVNDQLEDYKRLLEKRRGPEQEPRKSNGADVEKGAVLMGGGLHFAELPPGGTRNS